MKTCVRTTGQVRCRTKLASKVQWHVVSESIKGENVVTLVQSRNGTSLDYMAHANACMCNCSDLYYVRTKIFFRAAARSELGNRNHHSNCTNTRQSGGLYTALRIRIWCCCNALDTVARCWLPPAPSRTTSTSMHGARTAHAQCNRYDIDDHNRQDVSALIREQRLEKRGQVESVNLHRWMPLADGREIRLGRHRKHHSPLLHGLHGAGTHLCGSLAAWRRLVVERAPRRRLNFCLQSHRCCGHTATTSCIYEAVWPNSCSQIGHTPLNTQPCQASRTVSVQFACTSRLQSTHHPLNLSTTSTDSSGHTSSLQLSSC